MTLRALILAGGESRRMGKPKGLLRYFGQPQAQHLYRMLTGMGLDTFISCRPEQEYWFEELPVITDHDEFSGHGPVTGLLSADKHLGGNWLLVACDYPLLGEVHLEKLIHARNPSRIAVAYIHPQTGKAEPLIAIYEQEGISMLLHRFKNGADSLQAFLTQENAVLIKPAHAHFLQSIDTQEDYERIIESLED